LIPELSHSAKTGAIRPDGTVRDGNYLPRGYWEAKDTSDDIDAEIRKKIAKNYPLTNTIFADTRTAVLYQDKQEVLRIPLSDPDKLVLLLNLFFAYTEPDIDQFEHAVTEFKERVPELARGLTEKIADAHKNNPQFIAAFENFFKLCQTSLNPNISVAAVDEMLVQHLLTERLFRTIFDNQEFTQRNVIAAEVETEKNTGRVQRQKDAPITVIIGNPPYNVGQINENDNNKNRKYEVVDKRIRETFAADSTATNKNALSDMYVKFFRWAIDLPRRSARQRAEKPEAEWNNAQRFRHSGGRGHYRCGAKGNARRPCHLLSPRPRGLAQRRKTRVAHKSIEHLRST